MSGGKGSFSGVLSRALHPPVREWAFWRVQLLVVGLAAAHLAVDADNTRTSALFPGGLPVALLLIPVVYAAVRYGLSGSFATALWVLLLWVPDLLLPTREGHPGNDLIELAVIGLVAVFAGAVVDRERFEHHRADAAERERKGAEARYRQLFEINSTPILLMDAEGRIHETNPAARATFGDSVVGRLVEEVLGASASKLSSAAGPLILRVGEHDHEREFHVSVSKVQGRNRPVLYQAVLYDLTEERRERTRARAYTAALLGAQEDERRRIAQELHDEPLQDLIQLARRIEELGARPELRAGSAALAAARAEVLTVVARLREVARGLRPPALDQLGLPPAIRGLLGDVEDEAHVTAELEVSGREVRLAPELELGVFRIIQEATRNVVRHAEAHRLRVLVNYGDQGVTVEVTDDGKGFELESLSTPPADCGCLGLLGMRERASLLGGQVALRSAPGRGTTVEARIPTATVAVHASGALNEDPAVAGESAAASAPDGADPRELRAWSYGGPR